MCAINSSAVIGWVRTSLSFFSARNSTSMRAGRPRTRLQILLNLPNNLPNLEWSAFHFREWNRIDQILRANHRAQLAEIHFGNDHGFESGKHFAEVLREWIQMA